MLTTEDYWILKNLRHVNNSRVADTIREDTRDYRAMLARVEYMRDCDAGHMPRCWREHPVKGE